MVKFITKYKNVSNIKLYVLLKCKSLLGTNDATTPSNIAQNS